MTSSTMIPLAGLAILIYAAFVIAALMRGTGR